MGASFSIGRIQKAAFHKPGDVPRRRDGKIPDPGRSGFYVVRRDPAAALIAMSGLETSTYTRTAVPDA